MPHKLRKIRKKRGSRTHGAGTVGQHRKGSKGRRKAGRHKEGWTYIIKHEPDYFGKKGFKSQRSFGQKLRLVNVGKLEELVSRQADKKLVERKEGKVSLDLAGLGYDKLLGKGKIAQPLLVKVESYSQLAVKKIEDAGGRIVGNQAS